MKNRHQHSIHKRIAIVLIFLLLNQVCFPVVSYALTSGPTQPEFGSFTGNVSTGEMVDLYTGNFNYSINLGDIDGLPISLSYTPDMGMDDEASWVGLGWNLSYGAINRSMRGIPDDFNGEKQKREHSVREDITLGKQFGIGFELIGKELDNLSDRLSFGLNKTLTLTHNNKYGYNSSISRRLSVGYQIGQSNSLFGGSVGANTTFTGSTNNGQTITGGISGGFTLKSTGKNSYIRHSSVSSGFNAQFGAQGIAIQTSVGVHMNQALIRRSDSKFGKIGASFGTSTFLSNRFAYTPTLDLPIQSINRAWNGKVGTSLLFVHPNASFGSFETRQFLDRSIFYSEYYGHLYEKSKDVNGGENNGFISDFNSDGLGWYEENTPLIPNVFATFDLFNISGPGTNGIFRAKRNEVGVYTDQFSETRSDFDNLDGDLGIGEIAHLGINHSFGSAISRMDVWNGVSNRHIYYNKFFSKDDNERRFQFQLSSESKIFNSKPYDELGGTKAIRAKLNVAGEFVDADGFFKDVDNIVYNGVGRQNYDDSFEPDNSSINYLTVGEASKLGLDKTIEDYPKDDLVYGGCNEDLIKKISRKELVEDGAAPLLDYDGNPISLSDDQISEFSTVDENGYRSYYGLPSYNMEKHEVKFSIEDGNIITNETFSQGSTDYGLIKYTSNDENSINNDKGVDEMFDKVSTPAYANSFLLTGFVSPDYIDKTGDGISVDDNGTAYKFNYHKHKNDYQWRLPFQKERAYYHEGLKSKEEDDQASYTYGKKNLWYLHSVESKNMIAHFLLSEREDGLGVIDENGGAEATNNWNQTTMRLDTIKIYSKSELQAGKQTPMKSIVFSYNYESYKALSSNGVDFDGVPNHKYSEGKLTLAKVHTIYEDSERGALNAYTFEYKVGDAYKQNMTNRWGRYQHNPSTHQHLRDYPYALQKLYDVNGDPIPNFLENHAGDWNLNKVHLPSGATLDVEYESDDYAFVQNKRAAQMFEIVGLKEEVVGTDLTDNLFNTQREMHKYLVVKLPYRMLGDPQEALQEAIRKFLPPEKELYYDISLNLEPNGQTPERCKGWLSIDEGNGIMPFLNNNKDLLHIPVDAIKVKNKDNAKSDYHPVSIGGLQILRTAYPELIYPGMNSNDPSSAIRGASLSFLKGLLEKLFSFERLNIKKGFCRSINTDAGASWIRLLNPDYNKIGGDSRVKQITINDNWALDGGWSKYGTVYDYTTTKDIDGFETIISSGVATNEPEYAKEESVLQQPIYFEKKKPSRPTNYYYANKPYGGFVFPAANVGYSKVTVKPYEDDSIAANIERTKDGFRSSEFFTAKDFPTISEATVVNSRRAKPSFFQSVFKGKQHNELGLTQGISVVLNDMPGKPKRNIGYNAQGIEVSSQSYKYAINSDGTLKSEVDVMNRRGEISTVEMGKDFEMWHHGFSEITDGKDVIGGGNVDISASLPWVLPSFWRKNKSTHIGLKVMATTKVTHVKGILESVEVLKDGSYTSTENLVYDRKLGTPILTKTRNEFDDPLYSFTQPAYWKYEGMAFAGENRGEELKAVILTNNQIPITQAEEKLFPGDEVMITHLDIIEEEPYTVVQDENGNYFLHNRDGVVASYSDPIDIKVLRSGRRNMLGATSRTVLSRKLPIESSKLKLDESKEILNTAVVSYQDQWETETTSTWDDALGSIQFGYNFNPYHSGLIGNWRVRSTYTPNFQRNNPTLTNFGPAAHIQNTGALTGYIPFYEYDIVDDLWKCTGANFIRGIQNTKFDKAGNLIEEKDALDIFASAFFGFNYTLPTIVSSNAEYHHKHYDGFEEYLFDPGCDYLPGRKLITFFDCDHGLAPIDNSNLSNIYAHTGLHSLKVNLGQIIKAEFHIGQNGCNGATAIQNSQNSLLPPTDPDNCEAQTSSECLFYSQSGTVSNGCHCYLPYFTPEGGENVEYWISSWVASESSLSHGGKPHLTSIKITETDFFGMETTVGIPLVPQGPVIEGWQRIGAKVSFDEDAVSGSIQFVNTSSEAAYFDDFRIHPQISNTNTYAYDPFSLRLMATLDENNYATFYEYDDEGLLVRVKKETEIGVTTVQEGRMVAKPNTN